MQRNKAKDAQIREANKKARIWGIGERRFRQNSEEMIKMLENKVKPIMLPV